MPSKRLWSKEQFAEYMGVSTRTVDRWIATEDKTVPQPIRVAGHWRWPEARIEHWEQQQSGVHDAPVRVRFDSDCPGYPAGTGAAFDVQTAARLVGLQLASLLDDDFGRISGDMAKVMAARKAVELEGREFVTRIGSGPWFSVPRLYYPPERRDDGDGDDTPDVPSGGGGVNRVNRILGCLPSDPPCDVMVDDPRATVGPALVFNKQTDT